MSDSVTPFELDITEEQLDDLRQRLRATRWPEAEVVDDWSQGIPLSYTQELCEYWADEYDWRRIERKLNGFGQFHTSIDGLDIHFIHRRSPEPDAMPLLLTHGWPGSVVEFHKVIDQLADPRSNGGDPDDAFHVICPSLPGYGFGGKPITQGWGLPKIAAAWATLMARLGYDRYFAQGGDWGAMVTTTLPHTDPDHVAGIHLNMPLAFPDQEELADLTETETAALVAAGEHQKWGTGYSKQQSTRPQTIGYGLVDSPAGQAAWIVEKFHAWTDNNGHPEDALTRDELLDNVMLYWLPATGASSARLYWESYRSIDDPQITIPVACTVFPAEIMRPSRRWCERRFSDLRYWNEASRGGHFAAFEQPEIFIEEVRTGLRTMR